VSQWSWNDLPGRLIVVSGLSGSGKSTLVRQLLAHDELKVRLSVSATTRPARPNECDGRDYFFMDREAFETARKRGEFLESAEVYGNQYGTPILTVRQALAEGWCVILEIDVQGALLARQRVPAALLIFIDVPSLEVLEARLRSRATDNEATIQKRLATSRWELEQAAHYDVRVLNDSLERAEHDLVSILIQHGCRRPGPHPQAGNSPAASGPGASAG